MTGINSFTASLFSATWDEQLHHYRELASAHPQGMIDLGIGSPVDSPTDSSQHGLIESVAASGYPLTVGNTQLRSAIYSWLRRWCGVDDQIGVLPVTGTKSVVAMLPHLLGLGSGTSVVYPEPAYPTYRFGAVLAGAQPVPLEDMNDFSSGDLVWLNSPANPTGMVYSGEQLARIVERVRSTGAIVVSDECYLTLGWDQQPVSILHPEVCGSDYRNVLAVHSLSKSHNLAGYRAGFIAGDERIISHLSKMHKHAGLIMPIPVQSAMAHALGDDAGVEAQRAIYARRRKTLRAAVEAAGFIVDYSQGGLYLWVRNGGSWQDMTQWFAVRGIVVSPGIIYEDAGYAHVRLSLTFDDDQMGDLTERLR